MSNLETKPKPIMYNVWTKCPKCRRYNLYGVQINGLCWCPGCKAEFDEE